ncbi:unnamed protein product, partial [Iphiclides podalirius]
MLVRSDHSTALHLRPGAGAGRAFVGLTGGAGAPHSLRTENPLPPPARSRSVPLRTLLVSVKAELFQTNPIATLTVKEPIEGCSTCVRVENFMMS